jgi:anti-sigma factor RsiW
VRMTCRKVAELLIDYVDGTLPDEQLLILRQHICACPPCMFYMENYQTTIEVTHHLPDEPLPPEFEVRLRAVLEQWEARSGESNSE